MKRRVRTKVARKALVGVVLGCLVLSAILLPVSLRLPKWVEAEFVLLAWWAVWVGLLTWLLYRGVDVDDDGHVEFGGGRSNWILDVAHYADPGWAGMFDEGCGTTIAVVFVALLLVAAVLLVIEFAVPAIALVLLFSIGGMLARAVNDRHDCYGVLWRSLLWGSAWATLYIGPVAAIVLWAGAMLNR